MNTAEELLETWDRGGTIWSIAMGGLGPGYEQAIQVAAVEFTRAGLGMHRTTDDEADSRTFRALCDGVLKKLDPHLGGITGAIYGAATWLAWQWLFGGGPGVLIGRARAEGHGARIIQVSRSWPGAAGDTAMGLARRGDLQ